MTAQNDHILERVFALIEARKNADPGESYVASLHARGIDKIAGKIGEEAAETVAEAVRGDRSKTAAESADLIFHLMVLWSHLGVAPQDVFAVLQARLGTSGLVEKAARTPPS